MQLQINNVKLLLYNVKSLLGVKHPNHATTRNYRALVNGKMTFDQQETD